MRYMRFRVKHMIMNSSVKKKKPTIFNMPLNILQYVRFNFCFLMYVQSIYTYIFWECRMLYSITKYTIIRNQLLFLY